MAIKNATILDRVDILGSNDYQQLVDFASQSAISNNLNNLSEPTNLNAFSSGLMNTAIPGLVNKIAGELFNIYSVENPFAFLKRSLPLYGSTVQEIAQELIRGESFDVSSTDVYKTNWGIVHSAYHTVNYEKIFKQSYSAYELSKAFTSEYGLQSLIGMKMQTIQNSIRNEEYRLFLQLIEEAVKADYMYSVHSEIADIDSPTADELRNLSAQIRTYSRLFSVAATGRYNAKGVPVVSKQEDLVLITTPAIQAQLETFVLADAFNKELASFLQRTIVVDELPAGVYAVLADKNWFVVADRSYFGQPVTNPTTQVVTVSVVVTKVFSISPFNNAIIFGSRVGTGIGEVAVELSGIAASFEKEGSVVTTGSVADREIFLKVVPTGTITPETPLFVVPGAYTADVVITRGAGEEVEVVKTTSATYVDKFGALHLQKNLVSGDTVTVTVTSTYNDPSEVEASEKYVATAALTIA